MPNALQQRRRKERFESNGLAQVAAIDKKDSAPPDQALVDSEVKGLTIVGSANYKPWVMPKVLEFLVRTRDKYPFEKLVSHKFRLEDVNEGIRQSLDGTVVRAGLVPG